MTSPKKFVGLHSHSGFSLGDAIGTPADHINFAMKNGMDALALTDHGHMNGMSHQLLMADKLNKEGKKFKAIPGVEAYFLPSLSDWTVLKASIEEQKEKDKLAKKAKELIIGDELADTKDELDEIAKTKAPSEEEGGSVSENEEESKSKIKNPLFQRNHLVLLPKNSAGLSSLFRLVSQSYINGFYRFPRMDFDMLRREAKGNIVASSACVSGNAKIETNFGLLSLKEVVERAKTEEIFVLSFSETENREKFSKVTWGKKTRKNAKVFSLSLEDGKKLRLTGDHKVFTSKGWLRADELEKNMPLDILTSNTKK